MTNLVNDLVKLGFSTTQQARAIGVSVDVMKNHQQGRYARALEQWQVEKLEQIKELLTCSQVDMTEKLTKTAMIDELTRRIEWFKERYDFTESANSISDMADDPDILIKYGRFLAAYEARDQIKKKLFLGGYIC